ncbi:hypothetical protein ACS0TY_028104 [Phlomoides rotata]
MIMATAAVLGLSTGNRLHTLCYSADHLPDNKLPSTSNLAPNRRVHLKKQHAHTDRSSSTLEPWLVHGTCSILGGDQPDPHPDYLVDALLLLQKSMLEKQWNLNSPVPKHITCSGTTARRRRLDSRRKVNVHSQITNSTSTGLKGYYVKGFVGEQLLTHSEVVQLSQKIKAGLLLEDRRSRLKERLGCEPSDEQLASSLRISRANLQSRLIECSLAREKLAMSNVRLVMSIAQRYDNMGAEMPDLIQGGLIGLLRGIEKFDSTKGFKISTYVYWWIRQGVSRALVDNSRTLRLPTHLHERLSLIRNAKARLEEKGITPSIDRIAESLNMSQKKVRNATEAISKVFSLDREAFPSLNGLPGETLHSYIADNRPENNPWNGVDEWALKVSKC